ncbi:type IV secretion system protein VirB10 [Alcaligenes faecalis]|uniref:Type VI secretion protein n=1 Tax=Alcaligenes faecalis TaxID=511 RepID=A0AB33CUC1_ALCFA|nr:type IV secretion system protein VirB10 [Alcaligenes faecalis]ASR90151.1 type VI secretion protein [Alcaligenes faecalis]HBQ88100.1 type VI secretion protein [Alcaligenes faecalis]
MSISQKNSNDVDDRGPSDTGSTRRPLPPGARGFLWLCLVISICIIAIVIWKMTGTRAEAPVENADPTNSGISNLLRLPELKTQPSPTPASKPDTSAIDTSSKEQTGTITLPMIPSLINGVDARRLRSPLRAQSNEQQQQHTQQHVGTSATAQADAGPLASQLRPLELAPSVAGQLGNRNFLITQGTMIDCVMQTRLVTAQAGMLTCNATQNVMSANGKVVLIDAGTKFVGYQSGGIEQGQPRAFVTWHRLETPSGVILNLGSPGTGPLGEAGVDGAIDHHFWDRLGNAILLSLLGDLGNWASNQGNKGDGNIRFDNTREGGQEVVAKILEHSLDIPPTLYKNQGERVGIMVARDLDFSKVYDLKPTHYRQ